MTDLIEELRNADPVDRAAVEVPASLTARVSALSGHRRRRPLARALLASVAIAAVFVLAMALGRGDDGGRLSLADRAYAASTGTGIQHWKISIRTFIDGKQRGIVQRQEGWARGRTLHVLLFERGRLNTDIRQTPSKTRSWGSGMNDYVEGPTPKRQAGGPLQLGDPFADFRRAHDSGRLIRVNATTYRARPDRRNFPPEATLTYELDPKTARPTKAVLAYKRGPGPSPSIYDGARYRIVFSYDTYKRLPDTAANRAKLELLPHPGAGPSKTDARTVFGLLRDGAPLTAEQRRRAAIFNEQGLGSDRRFDLDGARRGQHGVILIPGDGYVAMMSGGGGTLATVDTAVKRGLAISVNHTANGLSSDDALDKMKTYVVVPDGVRAVVARRGSGPPRTFKVQQNVVALPRTGYQFTMAR